MVNKIIILDDVYNDIRLIRAEISRNFNDLGGDYGLDFYPKDESEFDDSICYLEMAFGNDAEKIGLAFEYFNTQFKGDSLIFIIDYHFKNKRDFDGIRIFDTIVSKLNYQIAIFFTGKSANERDKIRKRINQLNLDKLYLVRKPYFKNSLGELTINDKILTEENFIGLIGKYIGKTNIHKRL